MLQCPNCHNEVKPEERFCGNCGARLTPQTPPADPNQPPTPPRSIGKETVVLPAVDPSAPPPEPPNRPVPDATIIAGPAPTPPSSAGSYSAPPVLPTTPAAPPPSAPPGGMYPNATLPSGSNVPPPNQKSGGNVWKIIGIIAGIGLLACIALSAGAYLMLRRVSNAPGNLLGTANANISATVGAGLSTAVSDPTFQAISELPTSDAEPLPTAAASGGSAVLYKQTFDSASSDFDEDETVNASYKFVDGAYSVSAKKPNLIVWQKIKGDYGNAAISLDTTIDGPGESAAGLLFHYQDDKNFYLFTVTGDGRYSLDMYKDDNLTTLIEWTESSAINKVGELNSLRVETVGDSIRLYANDKLLDEISDGTFKRGKAAIAINTFDDPKLTVTFDNLVIRSLK
jgi:zinc-ribbon domain